MHASGVPMTRLCVESDISPIPLEFLQEWVRNCEIWSQFSP